jgi:menaquinone-specific isochorismate synthase
MIQIENRTLTSAFEQANNVIYNQSDLLFSYTERLTFSVDAIQAYANAKEYKGSRFYWTSPDDQMTFVGAGNAVLLKANTESDRFHEVEKEWKKIVDQAHIDNPYGVAGTGPIVMGGFSFDDSESSTLWENFGESRMVVPKFLLTTKGEEAYVTYNVFIDGKLSLEQMINEFNLFINCLGDNHLQTTDWHCKEKHDVVANEWKETIRKATKLIGNGEMAKVVLARELRATFNKDVDIPTVLSNLLEQQKQSYIFAIESESDCFVGATPERLVKVEENTLLSTCLAGTAPRGETISQDEQIGYELLNDEKNLQEHAFVVQMIKEAVEVCCREVDVPLSPVLYKLKNLQHLYTPVQGTLSPGYTLLDVVKRLHPTPAMGGVPRDVAMHFIRTEEDLARGWYSAPIGWMDANSNGEFAVAIRSGLIKGKEASLFAGCGIVKDSDPEKEFQETEMKFKPMLMALGE